MKIDLNGVRAVFPSWPSELDVAKCETNWAVMAQDFFCAASVLHDEMSAVSDIMHSGEPLEMSEPILKRIHTLKPALFCMAFALELAAKAATVRKIQGVGIEHNQDLPFKGHGVAKLCEKLPDLYLSKAERNCLRQAEEIIVNGKYPTSIKPQDNKSSFMSPSFEEFATPAISIYEKLMGLCSETITTEIS